MRVAPFVGLRMAAFLFLRATATDASQYWDSLALVDTPRLSARAAPAEGDRDMMQSERTDLLPCDFYSPAFAVGGVNVNLLSMAQAIDEIILAARRGETFSVHTLNLDHFVKLRSNPVFRSAYDQARFVTADGFPIVILARLAGIPIERTTGADLVMPLCREAARHQLPV